MIEIEDNSTEELSIRYSSDCNKKQNKRRKKCSNIPLGTPVEFTANLTLKTCNNQLGRISLFYVVLVRSRPATTHHH